VARIEKLVSEIEDPGLRAKIEREVRQLKQRTPFGLVFERHLPENALLALNGLTQPGDEVELRTDPDHQRFRVQELNSSKATIVDPEGAPTEAEISDLLLVKNLGEPIYPTLRSLGTVKRAEDRAPHLAIRGENYHALQLLAVTHAGELDCIYIDPPYNTGARDWKYNNDYVDINDAWRHSKWLSFMERRLKLARKLLKDDGVLIVTIDENEEHHLGVLLEDLFPDARRQVVSIVINPSGASGATGLSRVDEQAIFCFFGDAEPVLTDDDMLIEANDTETETHGVRWERLLRRGNAWYRASRPNLCYPVLLNEDKTKIVRAGDPYDGDEDKRPDEIDGHPLAWPVRSDGRLGIWRVEATRLNWLAERGFAYVSSPPGKERPTLRYLLGGTVDALEAGTIKVVGRGDRGQVLVEASETGRRKAKTVWHRGRHNAGGAGGTQLLNALLGERNVFSYPKSLYSVRDCLEVAIGDRDDAMILDFFAGSGTALHATCLMNATDGGSRRCLLVTNNEVGEDRAKKLAKDGLFPGDAEFERHGVFEAALRPRIEAALTGQRADGEPVAGSYLDGRAYADGFDENVEFLELTYLNPARVELGLALSDLHPVLWLQAEAKNWRRALDTDEPFWVDSDCGYAVLLDDARFGDLLGAIANDPAISHVFLVTDYDDAFAEMAADLGSGRTAHMVPRDYLRAFQA
jgi:adenine-specific DNA-methyltransferase